MKLTLSIAIMITSFILQLPVFHSDSIEKNAIVANNDQQTNNSKSSQTTSTTQDSVTTEVKSEVLSPIAIDSNGSIKSSTSNTKTQISYNSTSDISTDSSSISSNNSSQPINSSSTSDTSTTSNNLNDTTDQAVGIFAITSSSNSSTSSKRSKFRKNYRASQSSSQSTPVFTNTSYSTPSIVSSTNSTSFTSNTSAASATSDSTVQAARIRQSSSSRASSASSTILPINTQSTLTFDSTNVDIRTIIDKRMVFIQLPNSPQVAADSASYILDLEQQFAAKGEKPLYIFEPTDDMNWGNIIAGNYDASIDEMFRLISLKTNAKGLDIYVPFPEPNLPIWNNSNITQEDFGFVVNKFGTKMRKYLPTSQLSLLLDSKTYSGYLSPGSYLSLLPFVKNVDKTLIGSVGLQGFHWIEASNINSVSEDPFVYLNPNMLTEMANYLGVKKIWVNTGTLHRVNALNIGGLTIPTSKRATILSKTSDLLLGLKNAGFDVMVNIFMEDKFDSDERMDWSYPTGPDLNLLSNFFVRMKANGIGTSIFSYDPFYN